MPPARGMAAAWSAARRAAAVVLVALALAAILFAIENAVHLRSGVVHLLTLAVAFLVSLVVVHGLGALERFDL